MSNKKMYEIEVIIRENGKDMAKQKASFEDYVLLQMKNNHGVDLFQELGSTILTECVENFNGRSSSGNINDR